MPLFFPQTRGGRGEALDGREHRYGCSEAFPQHRQREGDEPAHLVQQLVVKGNKYTSFQKYFPLSF